MTGHAKEPKGGTKHTKSGNCWASARKCRRCGSGELCDVCHKHESPRGECKTCPPCEICEATP